MFGIEALEHLTQLDALALLFLAGVAVPTMGSVVSYIARSAMPEAA